MRSSITAIMLGSLLAASTAFAAEDRPLSLAQAQSLSSGEVTASGRIIPQFTAIIGSRLAASIVTWGESVPGVPLDVGMSVKKGQVLFVVERDTFQAKLDTAQAMLAAAQATLDNLTAPPRKEKVAWLRAAVAELDSKTKESQRDVERYQRLVNQDKTMPVKRLEEVQVELDTRRNLQTAAQAKLDEALAGPTPTEIAVAKAHVKEAETAVHTAQIDFDDTEIKAPFDGVITKRMKGLGDYVAGAPLVEVLELTSTDHLELELRLPEAYLPQIEVGKTMVDLHSALLKEALRLPIDRVIPKVDVQQGTFCLRVVIPPDKRDGLVPGTFITAEIKLADHAAGVVLPQQAVMSIDGKDYVMVAAGGKMARRAVEITDRLTEGVIVRSGVQPGEKVVVGPAKMLKDGASLPAYLVDKP